MLEGLQKAIGPPSWALRLAFGRQVGLLHRFEPPSWRLGALGASKLGSRERFGPPSEPQRVSKSYGPYRDAASPCGSQGSAAIFLVLHRIRSTLSIQTIYLSIYLSIYLL